MEEKRRQLAQNAALYPDLIPLGRQVQRPLQAKNTTTPQPSPATSSNKPPFTSNSVRPSPATAPRRAFPTTPHSVISVSSNDSPDVPKTARLNAIEISSDSEADRDPTASFSTSKQRPHYAAAVADKAIVQQQAPRTDSATLQ
ncbi:hypothetical protein BC628DRAFT_419900 [Trametes gibbosa]|nr:hypothetical protein BC628DRAFT_419900 [Trametes gibbosa]